MSETPFTAAPPPANIIDMHCHLAGIGAGQSGCFVSAKLRQSWRFAIYLRSFGVSKTELEQQGDNLVPQRLSELLARSRLVSKAVVLAMDGVINRDGALNEDLTEVYVCNEFAAAACERHSNLLFGASVNPYRRDALARLETAKKRKAVLLKWLPSIMHIDPSDPQLVPFYRKLVELDLPLLTHCGQERSFSTSIDEYSDPAKLRLPLSLGVKVIGAHIASTGTYEGHRSTERLVALMREYPNLYSDISSLTQLNKLPYILEALRRPEFANRLMYGSDFPLINTALVSPWFYSWRLGLKRSLALSRLKNPGDADVSLKQALGAPATLFARAANFLHLT